MGAGGGGGDLKKRVEKPGFRRGVFSWQLGLSMLVRRSVDLAAMFLIGEKKLFCGRVG